MVVSDPMALACLWCTYQSINECFKYTLIFFPITHFTLFLANESMLLDMDSNFLVFSISFNGMIGSIICFIGFNSGSCGISYIGLPIFFITFQVWGAFAFCCRILIAFKVTVHEWFLIFKNNLYYFIFMRYLTFIIISGLIKYRNTL